MKKVNPKIIFNKWKSEDKSCSENKVDEISK